MARRSIAASALARWPCMELPPLLTTAASRTRPSVSSPSPPNGRSPSDTTFNVIPIIAWTGRRHDAGSRVMDTRHGHHAPPPSTDTASSVGLRTEFSTPPHTPFFFFPLHSCSHRLTSGRHTRSSVLWEIPLTPNFIPALKKSQCYTR